MKTDRLAAGAALVTTLWCAAALRAQFSAAELQDAVDASFGPWDSYNVGARGLVYADMWSKQSEVTLDGLDAAKVATGSFFNPYEDPLFLRATITGPKTLHFSYLCGRDRAPWDFSSLHPTVQVGAGTRVSLPAVRFWQEASVEVGAGNHIVTWGFSTSSYVAGPGFLDQIWTEDDPRPRVTSGGLVDGQKGLATVYQVTTNKPCDSFAAIGLPPGVTIDSGTGLIAGTPTELGSFDARVKASNAAGSHTRSVLFRVLTPSAPPAVDLTVALDDAGLQWSQRAGTQFEAWTMGIGKEWAQGLGVTEPWSGSLTGLAKDGTDAATFPLRTAPQANRASNWIGTEVQGPGTFAFWHRIISFPNNAGGTSASARFTARVDGTLNFYAFEGITPAIGPDWVQRTITVPPGRHLLEFLVESGDDGPPDSDALVVFDQASFVAQSQSFTFEEWRKRVFPFSSDPTVDWEGDGFPLLLEYALGGSPFYHDAALVPDASIFDGHLTMTVHKPPGTSGLEYTVQANKSLAGNGWTTFGTEIMDEDANVLIVRCKKSVAEEPSCHLRLRVRLDDSVGP